MVFTNILEHQRDVDHTFIPYDFATMVLFIVEELLPEMLRAITLLIVLATHHTLVFDRSFLQQNLQ